MDPDKENSNRFDLEERLLEYAAMIIHLTEHFLDFIRCWMFDVRCLLRIFLCSPASFSR